MNCNFQGWYHNTVTFMSCITLWVGTNEDTSKVPLGHIWQGTDVVPGLKEGRKQIKS